MTASALVQRTKHLYIPLALIIAIALTFSASVQEARWTRHEISYALVTLLAILFGAATAISRFRVRTVIAYHLVLSIIVAAEAVGRFLPFRLIFNPEMQISVTQFMNIQIMNLLERINYWILAIINRQEIFDKGCVLFCIVFLLWNGLTWFMWSFIREKRVFEGLVLLGLILGVNIHQGAKSTSPLVTFTALTCFLLTFMAYYRMHSDWRSRMVDHPDLQSDWSLITLVLTAVILCFVVIFPIFTTPEGWQKIGDFLDQFQIEPITDDSFQPDAPSFSRLRITAHTPDISTIGTPLQEGTSIVMRVHLSDPVPPPPELNIQTVAIPRHYWRSEVYGEYTGSGWLPIESRTEIDSIPDARTEAPEGRYFLRQSFWIIAEHGDTLYSVNRPVWGDINVQLVSIGSEDTVTSGYTNRYVVSSFAVDVTSHELASAPSTYPQEITETYLQLPNTITERTRELTERIAFGAESNYEIVKRVEEYLRKNYTYNLDVPQVPEGRDAVDYFLFDAPGGFCSHYASAMVVMLRTQGIPARIVTGYSMGEFDYQVNEYRVRVNNAHAWVEVYFSGYGWIEFEPTTTLATFNRNLTYEDFEDILDMEIEEPSIHYVPRDLAHTIMRISLTLLGIGGGLLLYRRSDYTRKSPREKIVSLYTLVRRSLRSLGYTASQSTTPNEFLARYTPALSEHTRIQEALSESTSLYLKARFSSLDINEDATRRLQALWRKTRRQRSALWLRRVYQQQLSRFIPHNRRDIKAA
jgi:transglutaminase-like putative cysteine protease